MRIASVILALGILLLGVPTAVAEEPAPQQNTSSATTGGGSSSATIGPEPSSCRPYCLDGGG